MTYAAGIDLGTTFGAAAMFSNGLITASTLEVDAVESPSAVLRIDRQPPWLVGQVATRHEARSATRFKREIGSDANVAFANGDSMPPDGLLEVQLRWILERLENSAGGESPAAIALTHPSNWGSHRLDILTKVAVNCGFPEATLMPEPVAAAVFLASRTNVPVGQHLVVFDIGGGTTDVAIMRKDPQNFVLLGTSGVDIGGVDFDDDIAELILDKLPADADVNDEDLQAAAIRAKVDLSTVESTDVSLGAHHPSIVIHRRELEDALGSRVDGCVSHIHSALRVAQIDLSLVGQFLLVGGGAAIPLVEETISRQFERPTITPEFPKLSVAYGASITAAAALKMLARESVTSKASDVGLVGNAIAVDTSSLERSNRTMVLDAPLNPVVRNNEISGLLQKLDSAGSTVSTGTNRSRRDIVIVLAGLVAALVVVVGALLAFG